MWLLHRSPATAASGTGRATVTVLIENNFTIVKLIEIPITDMIGRAMIGS